MAMQEWQIQQHQAAATEMCHKIDVDPYAPSDQGFALSPPNWFTFALKMAEHELMIQVMRSFGRPV